MLSSSPVIVLGSVKYGDSSVILKTYSENSGILSFISGGMTTKKGPLKPVMAQPLMQLEVVYYHKGKSDLKRIKEARVPEPYTSILYDPVKNCIALFLAEVLTHLLREEESNTSLYNYISDAIYVLDEIEEGVANFHLIFLYKLAGYTGFKPMNMVDKAYFDLMSGTYSSMEPPHSHYLSGEDVQSWKVLSQLSFKDLVAYRPGGEIRQKLLQALLTYYRLHVNDFGELKSIEVLHTVLR